MTTLIDDNGQEIQIEDVPLTKQSVSFFDTKIKGDFSLNFNIPFTSENKKKLNYYTPQQVGTVLDQTWTITRNGNRLSRGQLVLQGIKDNEFELFFIAGNAEWISGLIKETADFDYASTLDDELTALWNSGEINHGDTDRARGIVWPLVDWAYRGNRAGSNWNADYVYVANTSNYITDYYPCVYLHSVFSKIFRQSGFLVNGSLFENVDFKRLIIAPGAQLKTSQTLITQSRVIASASANITFAALSTDYQVALNTLVSGRQQIFSTSTYEYKADGNMSVKVVPSGVVTYTGPAIVAVYAYKNGTPFQTIGYSYNSAAGAAISNILTNNTVLPIPLQRDDIVEVYVDVLLSTNPVISDFKVQIEMVDTPQFGDWVRVSDWVKLKAIDIVKFVFTYFGCVSSYDNQSKTVTIDILETLQDQEDWSGYIESYGVETQKTQSQNNLFEWKKTEQFQEYDDIEGGFGGGNLSTGIKQDSVRWFEAPFAPVEQIITGRGLSRGNYLLPRIDLITLEDAEPAKTFSSISNSSGLARLNGMSDISNFFFVDEVVRVTDGVSYSFYGVVKTVAAPVGNGQITLYSVTHDDFPSTTGFVYRQRYRYNNTPPRLMYVAMQTDAAEISPNTSYIQVDSGTETSTTNLAYGWFMKPNIGDTVDDLSQSLAIENTLNGLSHKDTYLKKVNRILGNPLVLAEMLLPESVFFKFKFDKFVHLKFKELSGRFFVKAIEEYKDARTVCRVELFQVD